MKRGTLLYNVDIDMFDILFPDGSNWGGLEYTDTFEILRQGVWVSTRLRHNGYFPYLVSVGGNGVPLGASVRI